MATEARRPIGQLLTDIVNEVTGLMQTELRLIKVEMNEKVGKFANGGGYRMACCCGLAS